MFVAEEGGHGVEAFEDVLAECGGGDFFFDDLGDVGDEGGDLLDGDDVGRSGSEEIGEAAFEGPGGGRQ